MPENRDAPGSRPGDKVLRFRDRAMIFVNDTLASGPFPEDRKWKHQQSRYACLPRVFSQRDGLTCCAGVEPGDDFTGKYIRGNFEQAAPLIARKAGALSRVRVDGHGSNALRFHPGEIAACRGLVHFKLRGHGCDDSRYQRFEIREFHPNSS